MSVRYVSRLNVAIVTVSLIVVLMVAQAPSMQAQAGRMAPPTQFPAAPLASSLTDGNLDDSVSAEWADGAEHPVAQPGNLRARLWTTTHSSLYGTFAFGAGVQPGPRHLRIGFHTAIAVGSVLIRGGGALSVLRPGAAYPGNLGNDSQWLAATRLVGGQVSAAEAGPNDYALWLLPPGTMTRALRLTHVAAMTDSTYTATLGDAFVSPTRLANLAPEATVLASQNESAAGTINDEQANPHPWDNGPVFHQPISAQNPAWVILSWPSAVALRGLAVLSAGFGGGDVETLDAAETAPPLSAAESSWHSVVAPFTMPSQYPVSLAIDWLDFGRTVSTRAIRLHMTAVTDEHHNPNLAGSTRNGARVWLTELMALAPVGSGNPAPMVAALTAAAHPHPPIAVPFHLDKAGYVTLVLEDGHGNRVRNLVSDTLFPAGDNTAWWDGSDDLSRDTEAAGHGVDLIPTHMVAPGSYGVRGLVHDQVQLRYQFTVYNPGTPPWLTPDHRGGWLADHTPPSAALFVPASSAPGGQPLVYLGSVIGESGPSLAWVTLDGRKVGDTTLVDGTWAGASCLARDDGSTVTPGAFAYVASSSPDRDHANTPGRLIMHLSALTAQGAQQVFSEPFVSMPFPPRTLSRPMDGGFYQVTGCAVRNGVAAVSIAANNEVLLVDLARGADLGALPVDAPQGLAFDSAGRLLVLSGTKLLRYAPLPRAGQLQAGAIPAPGALPISGLEEPVALTLDSSGNLYISDRGNSNQVKVFSPSGALLRVIGHAGAPAAGPYDAQHMNNPRGLAIDANNNLWVAEEDYQPKRVSLWTLDGQFLKAFYGPSEYGGGGSLDPADPSRFYYHGMEFHLDSTTGASSISDVLYRPPTDAAQGDPMPTEAYHLQGRRYFGDTLQPETSAAAVAMVYREVSSGKLVPAAAAGDASKWSVLSGPEFAGSLPPGTNLASRNPKDGVFFLWSDLNGDGKPEPEEVLYLKVPNVGTTIEPDLTLVDSDLDGKTVAFHPVRFTVQGVPVYAFDHSEVISPQAQKPAGDGGGQVLLSANATVLTTASAPYAPQSIEGFDRSGHSWSYPNLWPGLHPAHSAPVEDHPGELIGITHLLGDFVTPPNSDAGPLWAVNGNFGPVYLFTADGLFVDKLMEDIRTGKPWNMSNPQRNMLLNGLSLQDENFNPSIAQSPDGTIYLVDGRKTSLIRVDGLSSIRRITAAPVNLTAANLETAQTFSLAVEAARQAQSGALSSHIPTLSAPPQSLAAFLSTPALPWMTIDQRIITQGFAQIPTSTEAVAAIAGGRLYAAWQTGDAKLAVNAGTVENAPFKTGGALDLMLGTDPKANPGRTTPVAGDLRLLVYVADGSPKATLYRAVVAGTKSPVPFSSPARTVYFDQVTDVTGQVEFFADGGNYAISIPLGVLGLKPAPGERIKADIGVLRGDGSSTLQRVYWSNKATGIVADVPSEAELTPNLWGEWVF